MRRRWLLAGNVLFLVAVFGLSALVDANGRIAGLSESVSGVIMGAVFVGALLAAGMLIVKTNGSSRAIGMLLAILYLALLLPLILPWWSTVLETWETWREAPVTDGE